MMQNIEKHSLTSLRVFLFVAPVKQFSICSYVDNKTQYRIEEKISQETFIRSTFKISGGSKWQWKFKVLIDLELFGHYVKKKCRQNSLAAQVNISGKYQTTRCILYEMQRIRKWPKLSGCWKIPQHSTCWYGALIVVLQPLPPPPLTSYYWYSAVILKYRDQSLF